MNVHFVPDVSLTYSTTCVQTAVADLFNAPSGRLRTGRAITFSARTPRVQRSSTGRLIWPRIGSSQPNFGPFHPKNDKARLYPSPSLFRDGISSPPRNGVLRKLFVKVYRATPEGERRYSPTEVVSTEVVPVIGQPDPARFCTTPVER
jgi:hypothetical protein